MTARLVAAPALIEWAGVVLAGLGAPERTADVVARSLVESNLCGHDSHGVRRLVPYAAAIRSGEMDPRAEPELVDVRGALAAVEGRRAFGQVAAWCAVDGLDRLVDRHGIGAVAIRDCTHVGRLGEYVAALARRGRIALALGNADPTVAPYGGRERRLGTNPQAWAAPRADDSPPVVVDWATSATAEGKLAVALARGEAAPPGALVDKAGRPSTNPADFYSGGALLPFGGHKGYGLSVIVELVGGLLTGTGVSALPGYAGTFGTVLLALDIAPFVPLAEFTSQAERFAEVLAETPPAEGSAGVLVPGEPEARVRAERVRTGVPLPEHTVAELAELGVEAAGIAFPTEERTQGSTSHG